MSLRVLMMADTPADPNRGAAGTEVQTAHALRKLGLEVDTLWADDLGRRIEHGNLHLLFELPWTYQRAAVRAFGGKSYDVVHVNQPHGFLAARAVHRLSPRTVFIHRSHGLELNVEETLRRWRVEFGSESRSRLRRIASHVLGRALARHSYAIAHEADGHIVSSTLDRDFLEDRLHVDRAKIAVIPQAAPGDYLHTPAPPMTPERLDRVLHVAQFAFVKAPMIVAQAIERLPLRVTWVCDRAHHQSIRALLTEEANARLELLHWTSQDDLRAIYDAHGVFLFPSFFEGFGKAFLEAMSRGLIVIASHAGAMRDIIRHGENGLLVPAGSAATVADAVKALDLEHAVRMSAAAAETARQYSWDRVARETAAFYEARMKSKSGE